MFNNKKMRIVGFWLRQFTGGGMVAVGCKLQLQIESLYTLDFSQTVFAVQPHLLETPNPQLESS